MEPVFRECYALPHNLCTGIIKNIQGLKGVTGKKRPWLVCSYTPDLLFLCTLKHTHTKLCYRQRFQFLLSFSYHVGPPRMVQHSSWQVFTVHGMNGWQDSGCWLMKAGRALAHLLTFPSVFRWGGYRPEPPTAANCEGGKRLRVPFGLVRIPLCPSGWWNGAAS